MKHIEQIIMESVNERTKEFILRCVARDAGQLDYRRRPLSAFEAYEGVSSPVKVQARAQGSARIQMASQAYRSVALLGQKGS